MDVAEDVEKRRWRSEGEVGVEAEVRTDPLAPLGTNAPFCTQLRSRPSNRELRRKSGEVVVSFSSSALFVASSWPCAADFADRAEAEPDLRGRAARSRLLFCMYALEETEDEEESLALVSEVDFALAFRSFSFSFSF